MFTSPFDQNAVFESNSLALLLKLLGNTEEARARMLKFQAAKEEAKRKSWRFASELSPSTFLGV